MLVPPQLPTKLFLEGFKMNKTNCTLFAIRCFFLILVSALLFSACKKKEITLDDRDPLALIPDIQWALIKEPYTAFKSNPSWTSDALSKCKKGDIIRVTGKIENADGVWYKFESGYLPGEVLEVYSNKYKAQKMAKEQ